MLICATLTFLAFQLFLLLVKKTLHYHAGHTRHQKSWGDRISGQRTRASKLKTNFKMAASLTFEDVLEQVTRSDTEELQDSSDEESDQKTEAIESAVNCFTQCSDLGQNIALFKQEAKRYLKGLCEQHARGNDSFAILCESSLNTGAVLKDEACTWLDLIYRRLSARQRIRRPWYLEFTRDIPKHRQPRRTVSKINL